MAGARPAWSAGWPAAFSRLAQYLTTLRQAARLTQRALAQSANISRGAVQRAESGTAAPSAAVLEACMRACGGSSAETARAHLLRRCGRRPARPAAHPQRARPALIHTEGDRGAALAAAYERAGAPCPSDGRLSPGRASLPRTTAWRITNRKGMPATPAQLVTFLIACGIQPAERRPYINAYHIITIRRTRPTPSARRAANQITGATPLAEILEILEQLPTGLHRGLLAATTRVASREAHGNGIVIPDRPYFIDLTTTEGYPSPRPPLDDSASVSCAGGEPALRSITCLMFAGSTDRGLP
ncbi:helix-turn-helix domain-containing protein [Streptomyces sp. MAI_2237]